MTQLIKCFLRGAILISVVLASMVRALEPSVVQSAVVQPGAAQPGAAQPGAAQPGAAQPGAIQQPQAVQADPYRVVQQTTEEVLAIVKQAKSYYQQDPQRFHREVTGIMEKVVDFDDFARGVMGNYASERRYQALKTDAERAAFGERIQRFSSSFKKGLVETYGGSLLNINGERIETLPPRKGDNPASGSVAVMQNIYNASGKPYVVQYSMRRNKVGEWKLYNVIIEGINLGLTYRNQFAAAAEQNRGDLDKVIATWQVEPQNIEQIKSGGSTSTPAKGSQ